MRIGAVLAVAALLAGCTSADPVASAPSPEATPQSAESLASYDGQQLAWQDCGSGLQCATLRVPKDYAAPGNGDFSLALVRLPASGGQRLGSLVLNPGGPGASGVDFTRSARVVMSKEVQQAYDIVGFDPRGVSGSDPVDCVTDPELDELVAADPTPDSAQESDALIADAAMVGAGCQQRSPDIYRWMDTRSSARDMDVLRAALGDPKLNYYGASYGTALGAAYAEQFPDRVGRFVLDGAFPPDLTSEQVSLGQAQAFDVALKRFAAACLSGQRCPLQATNADAAVSEIQQFLAGLESAPLPAGDGRQLTESLGSAAVLNALYFPPMDWVQLRDGLAAAFAGNGAPLLQLLDQRLQRDPDTGRYANNMQEAYYATTCLDRPPTPLSQIEQRLQTWPQSAPVFGPYLAYSDIVCAQWPVPPVSQPQPIATPVPAPVLVLSTQYDPATPYQWGVQLAGEFSEGVLVSYNGDGHTAYRNHTACIDGAVDGFLVRGTVPATDPRCGY